MNSESTLPIQNAYGDDKRILEHETQNQSHDLSLQRHQFSNTAYKQQHIEEKIFQETHMPQNYQVSSASKVCGVAGHRRDQPQLPVIIVNNGSPFKVSDDQTILNMMQANDVEEHLEI